MTVADLLTRTLQDLNMVADPANPDPSDMQLAFDRLNDFIDDLKNDGLSVYTRTRTTWTLVSNTASYTIGSTGTISVDRPLNPDEIEDIGYLDTSVTPNYERLLGPLLTEAQYQGIPFKSLTAVYPNAFYYNPTYPLGVLWPFPIPTSSSLTGVLYRRQPVAEFAAQTDTISLPAGFRRFFRNQLVCEIASAFEKTPPAWAVNAAKESLARIKRTNSRLVDLAYDDALTPQRAAGNVYTGP